MTKRLIKARGLTHALLDEGEPTAPVALLMHGFPDSKSVWTPIIPALTAAGYRVIAPDMRGFGETDMAGDVAGYDIQTGAAPDMLALLDALDIDRAHLVGHDFGAPVAWNLAAQHPGRFHTLAALSVGHSRAFMTAGAEQKRRSFYILVHQWRGGCEALYRFNNWALLRKHWTNHGDIDEAIALLSRPGRLTAGLNWYRANVSLSRMMNPPPLGALGEEIARIPTLGVWSDGDKYLGEPQMTGSAAYVEAPWRYEKIEGASHWMSVDAPDRLSALLIEHWRTHASSN